MSVRALFLFSVLFVYQAQGQGYSDKYHDKDLTGLKITRMIDSAGFIPKKLTTDIKQFKALILQLSDEAITQINIDTWYLCSRKHDENFEIYNTYYEPLTKGFFDQHCKALIALMLLDGTIKQPR